MYLLSTIPFWTCSIYSLCNDSPEVTEASLNEFMYKRRMPKPSKPLLQVDCLVAVFHQTHQGIIWRCVYKTNSTRYVQHAMLSLAMFEFPKAISSYKPYLL